MAATNIWTTEQIAELIFEKIRSNDPITQDHLLSNYFVRDILDMTYETIVHPSDIFITKPANLKAVFQRIGI